MKITKGKRRHLLAALSGRMCPQCHEAEMRKGYADCDDCRWARCLKAAYRYVP